MRFVQSISILLLFILPLALYGAQVEKTMTVTRCHAMLKDGSQCRNQAETGKTRCWRHRDAAKVATDTEGSAGSGVNKARKPTKTNSTNVWQKVKSGTSEAWNSTCEAFDEAGDEFTKLMRRHFKKDPDAKK